MAVVPGHVLLLDDNPVSQCVLDSGSSSAGHTIASAESAEQALEILGSTTFDAA